MRSNCIYVCLSNLISIARITAKICAFKQTEMAFWSLIRSVYPFPERFLQVEGYENAKARTGDVDTDGDVDGSDAGSAPVVYSVFVCVGTAQKLNVSG